MKRSCYFLGITSHVCNGRLPAFAFSVNAYSFFLLTSGLYELLLIFHTQFPYSSNERDAKREKKEDPRHVGWGPKQRESAGTNHPLFKHDFLCNTPLSLFLSLSLSIARGYSQVRRSSLRLHSLLLFL